MKLRIFRAMMMEAAPTSETSVDIQLRTRQYILEDSELHLHICLIVILLDFYKCLSFMGQLVRNECKWRQTFIK
jgi:hypothetical protein